MTELRGMKQAQARMAEQSVAEVSPVENRKNAFVFHN